MPDRADQSARRGVAEKLREPRSDFMGVLDMAAVGDRISHVKHVLGDDLVDRAMSELANSNANLSILVF